MRIPIQLWLPICALILLGGASSRAETGRLKMVVIVSRHGVRSPTGSKGQLNQFSSQPWPDWDVPPGYLTPQGAKLMTIFGGWYRTSLAQKGLLAPTGCADAAHVSFYSDSDQRTVETGKFIAAGMFPGCDPRVQSEQHALAEGTPDPLFHSLSAGVGHPDHDRAAAAIAGRIGQDPAAITEAYKPQLEALQRILMGNGTKPAKLLLEVPAKLDSGAGEHLADLKGPLFTASTVTENFLLEYTNGLPMDQVGWGRVDLATLKQLIDLHTAASDLTRRTPYLAQTQASNALWHILQTLQQAVTGKPVPGALGRLGDKVVVLTGHDTNLSNIAGTLNLNWLIDARRDDTPPGGALVFELTQSPDSSYQISLHYTAQTLDQMRNVSPLSPENPPARSNVFFPGCSEAGETFPCAWNKFQQAMTNAIDPAFVK